MIFAGWSLAARGLAVIVAAAGCIAFGWRIGVRSTMADWQAETIARQQAEADQRREDARISRAADAEFERWRADQTRRRMEVASGLRKSLQRPDLAAVVVPAGTVDWLRESGADHPAPGPAASSPGR